MGFVVVGGAGRQVSAAHGVPPQWIKDIFGTKLWALQMAASRARSGVAFRTDCRSIIEMYKMGCSANTGAASRYARMWMHVHSAFEGLGNAIHLHWMPAHTTEKAVGMRTLSGGGC